MENPKDDNKFQLGLNDDVAAGVYSNLALITHSSSEFIVDFAQVLPGVPNAPVRSRIIMAPEHAKRLLYALQDNIKKYENMFGTIQLQDNPAVPPVTNIQGEA
jgi:hypothetical protein